MSDSLTPNERGFVDSVLREADKMARASEILLRGGEGRKSMADALVKWVIESRQPDKEQEMFLRWLSAGDAGMRDRW